MTAGSDVRLALAAATPPAWDWPWRDDSSWSKVFGSRNFAPQRRDLADTIELAVSAFC